MITCSHNYSKIVAFFDGVSLRECKNCNVIASDKYKDGFNPKKVYKDYYKNEVVGRFIFGIEYVIRLFRFFRAFKLFTINPKATSILDVGSGRGYTLHFLKKYYRYERTVGTQIERNSYKFSKNKLGLEIYSKDLLKTDFKDGVFDLVTIWHVLEHVEHPEKYIERTKKILKEGGYLIIEVPNFDSWTRRLTGKYWLGLDLKYHLHFFNKKSLVSLLKKYKFKIKNVHTFSLEYSTFLSSQSIISRITKTDQVFFRWIQNGSYSKEIILHSLLFLTLSPLCFLMNLLLYKTNYGEVLLIVAEK